MKKLLLVLVLGVNSFASEPCSITTNGEFLEITTQKGECLRSFYYTSVNTVETVAKEFSVFVKHGVCDDGSAARKCELNYSKDGATLMRDGKEWLKFMTFGNSWDFALTGANAELKRLQTLKFCL